MSTQHHCQCLKCRKPQQHHSTCGCKGFKDHHHSFGCNGFKNHGFGHNDHHFFQHDFFRNDHHSFHHDSHINHHHNCCGKRFEDRFEDRFLCDDRFRFRLAGLRSGMAFRLRQLLDCNVKIEMEEGVSIQGKITFVGTDFIEVIALDKKGKKKCDWKKKCLLIPIEKIKWVELVKKH